MLLSIIFLIILYTETILLLIMTSLTAVYIFFSVYFYIWTISPNAMVPNFGGVHPQTNILEEMTKPLYLFLFMG